ncbi:TRAP transporter large permease [Rhodoferax sp.]|uniref:TRAP transporter large permease n=1 Tax=Rhodoferax sp. TaxID=50421 RepID=UPI002612CE30|nr:TRAP transporter large permease [Rhodoferax sp.]MDD2925400.1 TRAP transporter large permease [Rhodoferax sp.]
MSSTLALTVGLLALVGLLLTGVPIYLGFLLLNGAGIWYFFGSSGAGLFVNSVVDSLTSLNMTTIPLFVLMGEILFRSGAVEVVFDSVDRMIGRMRGRLYVFTIALSTVFGALCGSAVAVVALLGRSVLPIMHKRGYDIKLSAAVIQGGASLAPIIPPSLMAVIIGSMANVSISGLLVAGILPGLLLAGLSITYVYWMLWRDPGLAPREDASSAGSPRTGRLRALLNLLPFLFIIFSVMGLMLLGIATPSESAATGVVGSIVTAAYYRKLSLRMLRESIASATRISTMILIIVAASILFGQLLAFTGATTDLVNWVTKLDVHPQIMFWLLMVVPFIICMFIDQLAFMLVAIPLYAPVVSTMGYDPIWFWTQFSINMTLASLTPPFGYTMYALRAAAPDLITLKQVFDASWPITWVFVIGMVVMTAVPGIITIVPQLLK